MATGIGTYHDHVVRLVFPNGTSNEIMPAYEIEQHIVAAAERYSIDRPDNETDDVTGDGGKYYAITTELTAWVEGFSRIKTIEYPAATIASDESPIYLEPEDWDEAYWASDVRYLFLPNHSPASTETMRISYTVPYQFSATNTITIPTGDFYAVTYLAAGLACQALAIKYSRSSDSTINADSVNHLTRASENAQRAKELMAMYEQHLDLGDDAMMADKPAGAFVDWDTAPGWPMGRQYVFHRNR